MTRMWHVLWRAMTRMWHVLWRAMTRMRHLLWRAMTRIWQVSRLKAGGWAEGSGAVSAGDVIVSVGGTACQGASLEKITRLLQVRERGGGGRLGRQFLCGDSHISPRPPPPLQVLEVDASAGQGRCLSGQSGQNGLNGKMLKWSRGCWRLKRRRRRGPAVGGVAVDRRDSDAVALLQGMH